MPLGIPGIGRKCPRLHGLWRKRLGKLSEHLNVTEETRNGCQAAVVEMDDTEKQHT